MTRSDYELDLAPLAYLLPLESEGADPLTRSAAYLSAMWARESAAPSGMSWWGVRQEAQKLANLVELWREFKRCGDDEGCPREHWQHVHREFENHAEAQGMTISELLSALSTGDF